MKKTFYFQLIFLLFGFSFIKAQTKIDVWDFGAAQLDPTTYNNMLDEATINSWYPDVTPGTTGKNLPSSFTVGILSWTSTSSTSDRLRTSNTNLTRFDSNSVPVTVASTSETLTGYLYVNATAATGRYLSLNLNEDDEVTIYAKSQNGTGKMTFEYTGDTSQKDVVSLTSSPEIYKFVAKKAGVYKIYDSVDKPFYYRILRKPATYVSVSGLVDLTNASDIPSEYTLNFTNAAGKVWSAMPDASNNYTINLPAGYTYSLSLGNANGYIISNSDPLTVSGNTTYNPVILKVTLYTLSGNITGLSSDKLSKLGLIFTPSDTRIYVPKPVVNASAGTYSVQLEANCDYTISASGVNDYYISNNNINITSDITTDIVFVAKPVYNVMLNINGLDATQLSKLTVTFSNLNESGYVYSFTDLNNIQLRDGVYSVSCSGLDEYPVQLGLTSNLKVNGTETSKNLSFIPVTDWSFDDATITSGVTTAYKGMLFTGSVYNEKSKGHLVLTGDATAKVPVSPGEKMIVYYYYSAKFTVDGGNEISTSSGSTNLIELHEFVYSGSAAGYMTIANVTGTTTYLTEIKTVKAVAYKSVITVGADKEYQNINDALAAVRCMTRENTDTVKIMIDPGNYEEMLVIDIPNVTLVNASTTPSIALLNKGVDIDANAVRITSYYGHGYNYFSMGTNQKWNADVLRVNKENGYTTYSNTGSGTTNGSYWNATVVVSASGFRADNIIFENSFNQYISKKESEDVVQEWTSGGKGTRPTTYGSTDVQNKSFVERAAAIAFTASADRAILNKCRVVGRQDSFYGAEGARIAVYKGVLMGATDYLFGGMTLICYQTDLAMNTSEASSDVAYITAAQQNTARGFLMYECNVTSAVPSVETASLYRSKPGYFGRPWQPTTSEVVFYSTTIETTNNPSFDGLSLIVPAGWNNSLGGTSDKVYEYNTIEKSGIDNSSSRVSWSKVITEPVLSDGTAITTFNFTKGTDNWDPISILKSKDLSTDFSLPKIEDFVQIFSDGSKVFISNVKKPSKIKIYTVNGSLSFVKEISEDDEIALGKGFWIVNIVNSEGSKTAKVLINK